MSIISHHTFFFGDLNFRVDFGGGKKENKEKAWGAVERGDFGELYQYDELQRGICNGDCLDGFREVRLDEERSYDTTTQSQAVKTPRAFASV